MSRRRPPRPAGYHWDARRPAHRPDGRPPCRHCRGPVAPPRRTFCCDGCVAEWKFRTDPQALRAAVFARDGGVCARCGLDAKDYDLRRLEVEAHRSRLWYETAPARRGSMASQPELRPDGTPPRPAAWLAKVGPAAAWRAAHKVAPGEPPWQVDHIVPVSAGGDHFSLKNLQTLCVPCHRAKSAAERAGRRQTA
jgi:5-methylcytosine-specific restriction endonuclease McrA